ncbi:putative RNA-directed DNA polymerase [Tanacetum coccineum]
MQNRLFCIDSRWSYHPWNWLKARILNEEREESHRFLLQNEFFVCYDYDMVNLANDDSSWILDSGATCHVATRKDYYSSYTPGDFGVVRMGNTGLSRIAGIGDICLKFDTGMELVLHNVKHVPDMRLNVISTGLLDEDGYHNSSGNGLWKVTLGSLIVARGKRESKLYMTHPKISKSIVNAVDNDDMTELWHKRLGHMSEKGMSILSKKNVLSGVHDINLKKCSHCLAGKQTRLAFKSRSPFRMENILDLVHSDVCGPMKTKTLGGCSYFVTFIDDHSRKLRVEQKKLKCIRTDNEGEYIGPFYAYCREHGIQHQKTPPKTPQLNGLAERMNRTLVERVNCMPSQCRFFDARQSVHISPKRKSNRDVNGSHVCSSGEGSYVCRLQKSLYGLKQAPRQWYKKFESVIGKQGYRKTSSDHCVFFQKFGDDDFIILLLYVDDMLIVGKNIGRIAQLKRDLSKSFSMKDLGPAKQIIGIRIFRDRGAKKLHISQEQYIEKVLCKFNMDKAKVVSSPLTTNFKLTNKDCPSSKMNIEKMDRVPYASAVGSLMPDLAHAVGVVSRFLSNPGKKHWEDVKWIFRYLREAEYMAATEACKELLWLKRFLREIGFKQQHYAVLCDNQSAIHLAKNSMFHKRTKHIDIHYHWIRDVIEDGMFELNKVHTDDNRSDMLTKTVAREKLKVCCSIAGMANSSS